MYDFGEGLMTLLKIGSAALIIFVPLGMWKLAELIF